VSERQDPLPFRPHFVVVPGAALADERLSDKAKLLLGILSWLGGADGRVWPTLRRIAVSLGIEARRARMLFAELVAAGWVAKVGVSEWGTTIYQLTYTVDPRQEIAPPGALSDPRGGAIKCLDINTSLEKAAAAGSAEGGVPPEVMAAAEPYLRLHSHPRSMLLAIRAHLVGPAALLATPGQVVEALQEMLAGNVAHFSARVFRGYLAKVLEPAGAGMPNGAGGGGQRGVFGSGLAAIAKRKEAK
jgi:hypothetical protein